MTKINTSTRPIIVQMHVIHVFSTDQLVSTNIARRELVQAVIRDAGIPEDASVEITNRIPGGGLEYIWTWQVTI